MEQLTEPFAPDELLEAAQIVAHVASFEKWYDEHFEAFEEGLFDILKVANRGGIGNPFRNRRSGRFAAAPTTAALETMERLTDKGSEAALGLKLLSKVSGASRVARGVGETASRVSNAYSKYENFRRAIEPFQKLTRMNRQITDPFRVVGLKQPTETLLFALLNSVDNKSVEDAFKAMVKRRSERLKGQPVGNSQGSNRGTKNDYIDFSNEDLYKPKRGERGMPGPGPGGNE
jgi:hypothetical protein